MDSFSEIKACYEAGRVMPGLAYRSPDVYEAEVERIFRMQQELVECNVTSK